MPSFTHTPVLRVEVLAALVPRPGETYLDATCGLGGHAAMLAPKLAPGGTVILNDLDAGNLARAERNVRDSLDGPTPDNQPDRPPDPPSDPVRAAGAVRSIRGNFAEAPRRLVELGLAADLVLADLGFSSNQMDDPARGFSFSRDGPLDMRLDPAATLTAADLVASLPEPELARIIAEYGEDPAAARIARKLVQERRALPITTTSRLAELVRSALGPRRPSTAIDPATRTFQALRIAVNDELGSLGAFLSSVERGASDAAAGRTGWLRPGARVAIISFHSLEDRLVKRTFGEMEARGTVESLSSRPITASEDELDSNPRARSAKLRAVRLKSGPKSAGSDV